MGTTTAATRSLPPSLGQEWCSYKDLSVTSSVRYSARPTFEDAKKAMKRMDGQEILGQVIHIDWAFRKTRKEDDDVVLVDDRETKLGFSSLPF
ncbi:hypothetical protein PsorP6_000205 [Peronosclerospora sorghi]|uniref:Uncharacterized protein n=1 Tax=Peronosclerospora sorghi TaxID=230839 RepID=A0ACC0WTA3_9STRA|nr:hypothetical protein PsorP6_000205 [Peronosclerospora sorghi]